MAKYFKSADYCPDDKDIYDFLDSQTHSINPILDFLKSRNIFASKHADKKSLQEYTALLFFDWNSAERIVDIINIREIEQRRTNRCFNFEADIDIIN